MIAKLNDHQSGIPPTLQHPMNTNLCLVSQFAEFSEYIIEIQDCATLQSSSQWVRISGANMPALLYRERLPIEVLPLLK